MIYKAAAGYLIISCLPTTMFAALFNLWLNKPMNSFQRAQLCLIASRTGRTIQAGGNFLTHTGSSSMASPSKAA
jgi:hypothetical protein